MKIIAKLALLVMALMSVILISCVTATRYGVNVDSIGSDVQLSTKSYIVLPTSSDTKPSDLRFLEFASYIEKLLLKNQYHRVDTIDGADIIVFLTYGIGDPREHQFTYSIPTWGQTGISSSSTSGTIHTSGNTATFSGSTSYTPTYGIVGSNTYSRTYTTYFRYLKIEAFDNRLFQETRKEVQLWSTIVTSTGSSGDLRRVMPYMLAAAEPYMLSNTGQVVRVIVYENDARANSIRGLDQ